MAKLVERPEVAVAAQAPLRAIEPNLPLLADLLRGDVVVYAPTRQGVTAIAEAHPVTVPSIYDQPQLGRSIGPSDEPAVIRVLHTGRPARRLKRVLVNGVPTVQDVFPVRREEQVVGAVVCEAGLIEHERQRR